ncbi:MAG: phosphomevalonate kinase [Candidatus Aenigmatarchaeota archaeon]
MLKYSAPGKLFISGEWSILEMGNQGIVAAVDKRVHSVIEESDELSITIDDFNIKDLKCEFDGKNLVFSSDVSDIKGKLQFIKESIETALRFLNDNKIEAKPFRIRTWGEESQIVIDGAPKKIGFGSSASSTVAVIASVLGFHDCRATKEEIFKLATIAHYFAQGKVGSAFDVAASTYGGLFVYSRFDPEWLTKKMESSDSIKDIVSDEWSGLLIEELEIPKDFVLLIGWTKESASTSAMVKQMNEFKKNNPERYKKAIDDVAHCAREAIYAWHDNDWEKLIVELQNNEQALARLGRLSGVNIETPDIKKLADIADESGGAGKLSGAGGGDCGIAVCFDESTAEKIKEGWTNAGLYIVDAAIDKEGLRIE